jgi:hypothetical protein
MNPTLHADVTRELINQFGLKPNTKGDWLQNGTCPECKKKELFANAEHPWVVKCGRENNCKYERHVKELYPDLFENWSDRYKVTETNPNASADAYLTHMRGFDIRRLKGCYEQESFVDRALNASTATVRFPLPGGGWWERLIDKPQRFGKMKARFKPGAKIGGYVWQPPGLDLSTIEEVWIVEGIFDAIALWLHGIAAVAAMSCNNWPEQFLAELARKRAGNRPTLVWALDTDGTDGEGAGQRYIRKWAKQARALGWDCKAAQIKQDGRSKIDWNDLHQRDRLSAPHLKQYLHEGALLIARTPAAKAILIYGVSGRTQFPLEFGNRLYWFALDEKKFAKAKETIRADNKDRELDDIEVRDMALAECNAVYKICDGYPRMLYFQRNDVTDEAWYYFRINRAGDQGAVKNTFTGSQITAAAEFGKRLTSVAAACFFTGTTEQLLHLLRDQTPENGLKTVETIDFIGYSKEHGAYIFGDVAVKDGNLYELNSEDYFEIGRLSIKSLLQSMRLQLNTRHEDYTDTWYGHLWTAFGVKGVIALAFWLGSLFAEQIRATDKSFPFLELIGEAGSGKSTLIEFLWKLLGRDHEGTDPTKSTLAGRTRTFGQVGNLPMVMIEADRSNGNERMNVKQFDWDELKTLYNGRIGRARGHKSAGNETYEPPFRGSIVISQNAVVAASDAVLQRIVHINLDKSNHSAAGGLAGKALETLPMEKVSGFTLAAVRREKTIMPMLAELSASYETMLKAHPALKSVRICKNHAQLMACVEALVHVTPITPAQKQAALNTLIDMAAARQQAINADHPLVTNFWEMFDHLNDTGGVEKLNHSRKDDLIAVSLPELYERATQHGTRLPDYADMKRLLPESRERKFVGYHTVNSAVAISEGNGKSVKCWVFRREGAASRKSD